ncbi:hypothetical protein D3C78_1638650 [compost metagenome]
MRELLLMILPSASTISISALRSFSLRATRSLKKPRVTSIVDTPHALPFFWMAMAQLVRGSALASSLYAAAQAH